MLGGMAAHRRGTAVALTVSGAYSFLVAATTPFTVAADAAVAAPLAVASVLLAVAWRGDLAHGGASGLRTGSSTAPRVALPWFVLVGLVVGWEVVCFVALPRSLHPTLSSMYDAVSRCRPAKAVIVFGWLALGRQLVRR